MEHHLKTDPEVFDDIVSRGKRFEVRFNDRNYQVGDSLVLKKTRHTGEEMKKGALLGYVGAPLYVYVTYILEGPIYGLANGWVIMSIDPRDLCLEHKT